MRFETLEAWLAWQESLNPRGIELGLERVRRVLAALDLATPPFSVLTVAGTNGKGSVATYAASMLQHAGLRAGRYLSPHILHYNERIAINGVDADDDELCAAFDAVDRARDEERLTYFEFGTLAALEIFRRRDVDVAVLEVGLGGRLDAVNAIDADVSVVVSVGLDHMDWLGSEIDDIAREKAGVFRANRPAIYGSNAVPQGIVDEAERIGAPLQVLGRDFHIRQGVGGWAWDGAGRHIADMPDPPLAGAHQYSNAATAVAAVLALHPEIESDALREGLAAARLGGRLQSLGGDPEILMDVGHNPDAAARIAAFLCSRPKPTSAVLAMLGDKDAAGFVRELAPHVKSWHLASLTGARGQTAEALDRRLVSAGLAVARQQHRSVADAAGAAIAQSRVGDRVLVLGSFHTVAEFLVYFDAHAGGE